MSHKITALYQMLQIFPRLEFRRLEKTLVLNIMLGNLLPRIISFLCCLDNLPLKIV
jgi:hypothetical protein